MTDLRQDRVPDPTLSRSAAPLADAAIANGRPVAAHEIVLSVLLRTIDSSAAPAPVSWAADSIPAALAIDIIAASGGDPGPPQGAILSARFANLPSAVLAARRITWALQGLAETSASLSAAIAIQSAEEGLPESAATLLPTLPPGQVLLSAPLAESLHNLPGLTLQPSAGTPWRTLQWRPDEPASLAADEQAVLGLIRALGRPDPVQAPIEAPAPAPGHTPPPAPTGVYHPPTGLGRAVDEPEPAPFWKKPWVVVSAAAAVLVLAAVLIIPAMVSGGHGKETPSDTSPKTSAPAASQAPVSNGSGPAAPSHDQNPPGRKTKQPHTEAKPEPKTDPHTDQPPPRQAASCDLTETEIPLSLQRAGRLMYAGKLPEAQDAYQHLLGCPSARDKATEGLRLVRQRMAAQSP